MNWCGLFFTLNNLNTYTLNPSILRLSISLCNKPLWFSLRYLLILFLTFSLQVSGQSPASLSEADLLFNNAVEYVDKGNYAAARDAFERYLQIPGINVLKKTEAEYLRGFTSLKLYHPDGEKLIQRFIEENPRHPRAVYANYDLANFFYEEKVYAKAVNYFKQINFGLLNPTQFSQAKFRWAYSLFNLKKLTEALEQFNYVKSQNNQYSEVKN